jgi:hypothetical protein
MAYTNIDDPSAYFQATTYTGAGADTEVTNSGNSDLKPDFLWIKNRTADYGHFVVDSNRNISYEQNSSNAPYLETESTAAENNNQNWMASVNTDGFTTGISEHINNNSGSAYVAWQWKANGGTTASNTDGSITSTVQANQDAGFSIVTYTTAGSTATIGHGLGAKPDVILLKKRNGAIGWLVRHVSTGTSYLSLNSTAAAVSNPAATWTTTEPTTSVYSIGTSTDVNIDGGEYVAYCFASKQGYSKFGKYVGNANTNGTFVYLGFKPAFVMVKRSDGTSDWTILDNKREGYNVINKRLVANSTAAEATYNVLDFVSNGFKFRDGDGIWNGSGSDYIYMAFAENPFTTSTGVPTTAR